MMVPSSKHRVTLVATWLCFLAASVNPSESFALSSRVSSVPLLDKPRPTLPSQPTSLKMSADLDNQATEVNALVPGEEESVATPPNTMKVPKSLEKAVLFFLRVYSVFVFSAGTFFTCMLLLNVFGYDYAFSKEEGFRVDTIEQLRTEKQFRKAAEAYAAKAKIAQTQGQYIQPSDSLPKFK
ncbi:expressed unknown protein [Seminavis robusta]|uniref:Transmembrane protein n=1 Tax=Seminavis robusta TaxID=568900 RepID=A0A9N8H6X1_9STRA|nr:expressed unknown protein [Seminavis robusta]|eukprot:Sro124_g059950.1 n/a (182) ;mRNA; f:73246-73791